MKITRSTKCSTEFTTASKREQIADVLSEYARLCNVFIEMFWEEPPTKYELLASIVNEPESWFTHRMRKVCAREAIDMILSAQNSLEAKKDQLEYVIGVIERKLKKIKPDSRWNRRKINDLHCSLKRKKMRLEMMVARKPKHRGKRMCLSCTVAELQEGSNSFNFWLHLHAIGRGIVLDIPIKSHKHFKKLEGRGRRMNSYVITKDYVQFSFEIETGPKKEVHSVVGIDTGINALASLSTGEQFGREIKEMIQRIKRCEHGSEGQKTAIRALKQRMDEIARDVTSREFDLVVVENLKGLGNCSKLEGRTSKNTRSDVGSWNRRYWIARVQMDCEDNRVSFRSVSPYQTSIACSKCGHTDERNREGETFTCQNGHTGNADINAAVNIALRFLRGPYGTPHKSLESSILPVVG